jgi:hypothetical protein
MGFAKNLFRSIMGRVEELTTLPAKPTDKPIAPPSAPLQSSHISTDRQSLATPQQLPTSLSQIPDSHDPDAGASVWARAMLGRGGGQTSPRAGLHRVDDRIPTAAELEKKRLNGQGRETLREIYGP